jgi:flagellar protein FlaJ
MSNVYEHSKEVNGYVTELLVLKEKYKGENEIKKRIKELIKIINERITIIYSELDHNENIKIPEIPVPKQKNEAKNLEPTKEEKLILSPELASQKFYNLSDNLKKKYIQELNIDQYQLDRFIREQKKSKELVLKKEDYSIYEPNEVGKFANRYAKHYADLLISMYPKVFTFLFNSFERVNMPIISRTYVSMMLFFSVISLPAALVLFFILNLSFQLSILFVILMALLAPLVTFIGFYFYPSSLQSERKKKIKNELPFALVYMSAIAGSGATPISIFELLAESNEYPELRKEIKKILNYVNLFGYDLTTSLRSVSKTTPSEELIELLNGLISTIETGGDLKNYLKNKADEALNTYRLERKKKAEALATYSEVYTAILIASPLLLIVTLAIINSIGGDLGGMNVSTIAWGGILIVLPLLNIGFMTFVNKVGK